ncbi:MAG: thiamine phosphate synthase, partial [Betaproteobacteria bacterium]|nr:thiamine phosphate synthase [Betaproteobacteria bacterium]
MYAITPDCADTARLIDMVAAALKGGITTFQYRNKAADARLACDQAAQLRALTHRNRARLIVNDDAELALSVGADGVHLGRDDGDVDAVARLRRETGLLVGVSCYDDLDRARAAAAAG